MKRAATVKNVYTLLISFLFLVAIFKQMLRKDEFINSLYQSSILSQSYIEEISLINPIALIIILLLILIPKYRDTGVILSVFLMLNYTIYLILLLRLSQSRPCSCAGVFEFLSIEQHILLNGIILGIGMIVLFKIKVNIKSFIIFFILFYSCTSKKGNKINDKNVRKLYLVDSIQIKEISNFHFANSTDELLLYWDYSERKFKVYDFKGNRQVSFHLPVEGPKSFGEILINASIFDSVIYALGVGVLNSYDFKGEMLNSHKLDSIQFLFVSKVDNNNLHIIEEGTIIANLSYLEGERTQKAYYENHYHYFKINLKEGVTLPLIGFPTESIYLNDEEYFDFQFTTFSDFYEDTLYFTYELDSKIFKLSLKTPTEIDYIDLSYLERKPPLGTDYNQKPKSYDYLYENSVIEALSVNQGFIYLVYSLGVSEDELKAEFPNNQSRQNGFEEFLVNNNKKYLVVMDHSGILQFQQDVTEMGDFVKVDENNNLYFRPNPFLSSERNYEVLHIYALK
ncbi:hypothetical protein GCM10011506_37460 [Marivirga lumbricoides]|uniref:Methylamine utilisation protein MauE domain-containing protein n=1 Tax=Marivirga lumbricoides TaxID=1046115 RepID=A0ABQ1MXE3_9BACT|nr:hypothetical protein GCM10011506_37460 [Marivirga lumbricoides]